MADLVGDFAADATGSQASTIIVLLIGLCTTLIGALVWLVRNGRDTNEQVTGINAAVNHTKPDEERIYDKITHIQEKLDELAAHNANLAEANHDFVSKGWTTLPEDLSTAAQLTQTIRALQHGGTRFDEKLDELLDRSKKMEADLLEHVEWEMNAKYGLHGDK